jgi:hypothetical protein
MEETPATPAKFKGGMVCTPRAIGGGEKCEYVPPDQ